MNLLSILSVDNTSSVSVMINDKIVDNFSTDDYNSHSKVLPGYLVKINSKYDLGKFDGIAISIGPGSYTGLRIGLSLAKGLAFSKNLPLIPITTFDIINYKIINESPYWILVHSHRDFYFAQKYNNSIKIDEPFVVDINKLECDYIYYSGKEVYKNEENKTYSKLNSDVMLQIAMDNYNELCIQDINSVSPNYISNVKLDTNV